MTQLTWFVKLEANFLIFSPSLYSGYRYLSFLPIDLS